MFANMGRGVLGVLGSRCGEGVGVYTTGNRVAAQRRGRADGSFIADRRRVRIGDRSDERFAHDQSVGIERNRQIFNLGIELIETRNLSDRVARPDELTDGTRRLVVGQ